VVALVGMLAAAAAPASAQEFRSGSVYAQVGPEEVVLGNLLVERSWARDGLRTTELTDKRREGRVWSGGHRDFTLRVGGSGIGSEQFAVNAVRVEDVSRGLRVELDLSGPLGLTATRIAEAYRGIAGFRTQTVLRSPVALPLAGATLDEAAAGAAAPTLHAFRAGADWREPDWEGPPVSVGDPHAGTWRDTRTSGSGSPLEGAGQWLSLDSGGRTLFMVMERPDFPSSRAGYDGEAARLEVDYSRDGIFLGPFEENAHVENPTDAPGRQRTLRPGEPFALEPAFTGFGLNADDEAWQHHRYLGHRMRYRRELVFNSNGTDSNRISTGAKDDMDYATVQEVAPLARRLGIETFVLDDGWQAVSGDWEPDSPEHSDPRGRYPPRFPDAEFRAVREAIAPMRLGLWMSPMSFHPQSRTFRSHPEWACTPTGHGTAAANALQPDDGSNEAGIGLWSPAALPHIEAAIRRAIEEWGVQYFKFDFLVWLDCAGQGDLHDYHDAFVRMLDRVQADHPDVTLQIDETNDYRMFPFESVARGPSWFQNGTPPPERLLHNLWNLSPYVPVFSLGQHMLGGGQWREYPVGTLMAAAMLSHATFFSDLRDLPAEVIDRAAPWAEWHKANRHLLDGVVYPLLDDPLEEGWTALQSWDPRDGSGALLAFRQDSSDAARTIALRNVPPGRTFDLALAPSGTPVGTVTSEQLSQGIEVQIPEPHGTYVVTIEPR
jgi:hypothetical protein